LTMMQPYSNHDLVTLRRKKSLYTAGLVIGIALFFIGVISGFVLLCFPAFVAVAVFGILTNRISKQIKDEICTPIMQSVLADVFERSEYSSRERLPDYLLELEEMQFPFDVDRIEGSDYIHATYQGLNVEMSDIRLVDRRSSGKNTSYVTVFEGLWLICDFGKPIAADLLLRERQTRVFRFADKWFHSDDNIETENEAFNEKFVIRSRDQHGAFYVLTPHMMERILQADAMGAGDTYIRFMKTGKVHIAINSGRDAFEYNASESIEQMKHRFASEIRYATDLIDILRLSDTIQNNA